MHDVTKYLSLQSAIHRNGYWSGSHQNQPDFTVNRNMSENITVYQGEKTSLRSQPPGVTHSSKLLTVGELKRYDTLRQLEGEPRENETVLSESMTSEDFELIETLVGDRMEQWGSLMLLDGSNTEEPHCPTYSGKCETEPDISNQNQEDRQPRRSNPRDGRQVTRGLPRTVWQSVDQSVPPRRPDLPNAKDVGWTCPSCTFAENPPLIPGCQVCFQDRPADYKIPDRGTYIMDQTEKEFEARVNESEIKLCEMFQTEESEIRNQNRKELFEASEVNLTVNQAPFECPICLTDIKANEGVRLQECLHEICRNCCAHHINLSNDPEIMCPYMEGDNACQQTITHREIRQIVGELNYDKYVKRSLKSAEAQSRDAFHCLTPNCEGFCFYHKDRTFFQCPRCLFVSCFICKVIHEGQTCREYKDDTKRKAINEETAKQTEEELQRLLRAGRAMNCPQCGVVIQKNGGCPNMICSKCQQAFRWTGIDM